MIMLRTTMPCSSASYWSRTVHPWKTHHPRSRAPQAPCSCQLHPTAVVSAGHVHEAWWDDRGWPLPWQPSSCSLLCCYSLCWKANQRYGNTRACLQCRTWNAISPMESELPGHYARTRKRLAHLLFHRLSTEDSQQRTQQRTAQASGG